MGWAAIRTLSESDGQPVPAASARGDLRDPASLPEHRVERNAVGADDLRGDPTTALQGRWASSSHEDEGVPPFGYGTGSIAPSDLGTLRSARFGVRSGPD
ncbi:MAG: hypothetical protein ACI9DF_001489 [Verrucomicrobiales bacterium]|jgi:hypothetical protein